ncbi:tetratricopeptide repeat protein, partial [Methanobrevibacter sp.]|uniref:tetratricopeptide repeat protein n=1 Tax=Methanobrevibacter sp. TaxID=66852 RepID=UPI00386D84B2
LAIAKANRLNRDFNDAISVYDSVLKIDYDSFEAFKGKAYTYYDWEKYVEAGIFFKKANSIESLDEESKKVWDECRGF